jgi:hypothetical protein
LVQFAPQKLVGFTKVKLDAGQSERVTVRVSGRELSYWSTAAQRWVLAGGDRKVYVGASSRDIRLQGRARLREIRPGRETRSLHLSTDEKARASTDGDANTEEVAPGTPTLTVNGGSVSARHVAGKLVTVTADAPPPGQKFSGWSGDTQILVNPSLATTTATMPSIDVTITATYEPRQ